MTTQMTNDTWYLVNDEGNILRFDVIVTVTAAAR